MGLPLHGVRVVDLAAGRGAVCGRLLAELGADVTLVEPPGGSPARGQEPLVDGTSLLHLTQNATKRAVELTHDALLTLIADADIVVEAGAPGELDIPALRRQHPRLVVTSITDFGQDGPYRDWIGSDAVHLALSSVLARSGTAGRPPLLPPGRLPTEHATAQAVWATLVAYRNAQRTGHGEHVDVSVLDATVQSMDAAWGIGGSASGGVPAAALPPGRPDMTWLYPVFDCADGRVRLALLGRRQWRAMFAWLGEPAAFADPKYDVNQKRYKDRATLYPLMAALFAGGKRADLVAEGQRRGIAIDAVRTASEVLADEHFAERGAWVDVTLPSGRVGRMPGKAVDIDCSRGTARAQAAADDPPGAPPLTGLRVLDLGVIVVGAETGRLFADLGADVVKIESSAFPDGSRASSRPGTMHASFAWGHRNKRSLGLDLRSDRGRRLFLQLAARSDVVLSNFKPGTMESLGIGYDALVEVNPAIVVADSSALGRSGPAARRMGYGPLVRAATGVSDLWRYPDSADSCDATTVYPDHVAARIGAAAVLATLVGCRGGTVSVTQSEVMLTQFAGEFLRESLAPGSLVARGSRGEFDAPQNVFRCSGDDAWVVIWVQGDDQWARLCEAIEADDLRADPALVSAAGRVQRADELEQRVEAWTTGRSPDVAMRVLQQAGVPAGAMRTVTDLPTDPHLVARGCFTTLRQPSLGELPTETGPAHFSSIAAPELRPAPSMGQHTREIARDLLGLDDAAIDDLLAAGVLEQVPDPREGNP